MRSLRCLAVGLGLLILSALGNAQPLVAAGGCVPLVADGGFESGDAWVVGQTQLTPEYVTHTRHSGQRSLAMGITNGGNVQSYSSARQTLTIPSDAPRVTLSFWVYPMASGAVTTDYLEVVLLDLSGNILDKPWYSRDDSRTWNLLTFDLSGWRGRTLQLYFNVYNDGVGGTAAMFLDDVSVDACPLATDTPQHTPSATATLTATASATHQPTSTRTPTPSATTTPISLPTLTSTALPSQCRDVIANGGFESGWSGWIRSPNAVPAELVTAPSPVYAGATALRLGSETHNVMSYSSVRYPISIPSGAVQASLGFWAYAWSEAPAGQDRQEVVLLGDNDSIQAKLISSQSDERAWRFHSFDLTGYSGRSLSLYLNVFNDGVGGRTALYLDDVRLIVCDGAATVLGVGTTTQPAAATPRRPSPTRAPAIASTRPPVLTATPRPASLPTRTPTVSVVLSTARPTLRPGDATALPRPQSSATTAVGPTAFPASLGKDEVMATTSSSPTALSPAESGNAQGFIDEIRSRVPVEGLVAGLVVLTGIVVTAILFLTRKPGPP